MQTHRGHLLPWAFAEGVGVSDAREHTNLPFLGFLAGSFLSACIWAAMLGVLWMWRHLPI